MAWSFWAGKDLSWDVLNHHVYLPWSWVTGRYETDLFAAGPQAYLHPLGYLPFIGLVSLGLPDRLVAVGLALLHALVALPLWRIVLALWPDGVDEPWWRLPALALAALAPTFLLVAGTSSSDPISAAFVLAGLMLALGRGPEPRPAIWAGVACGVAIAIKPSNVVFLLALAAAWRCGKSAWRPRVVLLAAGSCTALLVHGPWSWWLWQTFGNPVFPLFNHWFQSPFAPIEPAVAARFLPQGLSGWLWWPWQMAQPQRLTHTEALAPDLRPLVASVGLGLAALAHLVRLARRSTGNTPSLHRPSDLTVLVFAGVAATGWLATSANSRYALPLMLLAGPIAVRALQLALPRRVARITIGLLMVLQVAYWGELGARRFDRPVAWGQPAYITADVPSRLRDEPVMHLALGTPSYAALASQMHPHGLWVNAISSLSLPTDGPLGQQLKLRLDAWSGRTRILARGLPPLGNTPQADAARRNFDRMIQRLGLRVNWRDCLTLRIVTPAHPVAIAPVPSINLMSCAAETVLTVDADYDLERQRAERAFAAVEASCPRVFSPRPLVTDAALHAWHRHYMSTDARLTISETDGVLLSYFGAFGHKHLGSVDDVIAGRGASACSAWQQLLLP